VKAAEDGNELFLNSIYDDIIPTTLLLAVLITADFMALC
jgi:hypothetical protein